MNWFWLNIPLAAVFFLATAGIPLWLVLRRPDARETGSAAPEATPQSLPVVAVVARPNSPSRGRRELVGASPAAGGA